ncbi:hypothetical protein F5Y18DRAFT_118221 [Xylariaceae sp. FL1019]|nr:hypothetical protein F5Y18DRAFT_118221 [Xylariaceae sp. FL1019]
MAMSSCRMSTLHPVRGGLSWWYVRYMLLTGVLTESRTLGDHISITSGTSNTTIASRNRPPKYPVNTPMGFGVKHLCSHKEAIREDASVFLFPFRILQQRTADTDATGTQHTAIQERGSGCVAVLRTLSI